MSALNQLLDALKVEANIFDNGQYCGVWAVDTSGSQRMTFHVVTFGSCKLQVGEQQIELNEGDAVFFPSDASHRVMGLEDAQNIEANQVQSLPMALGKQPGATGLVCGYFDHQNPVFNRLLKQLPECIVVRAESSQRAHSCESVSASAQVIQLMLQESLSSGQRSNFMLNRLADCLLYLLLRDHVDIKSGIFAALIHPKLSLAMQEIHADAEKKWSVETLANLTGMSRSAFSSLFKQVTGESPMDYVSQWRMTLAYSLLADQGVSTFEAALSCGYESEASFAKAFKRIMGMGPGQVRRKS